MTENESTSPDRIRLRGRLSGDSIEGGGTFLVQPDGRRFELVVPAGTTVPEVSGGAPVVVSGRLAPELASFRQQGRMFVVTSIEPDVTPT